MESIHSESSSYKGNIFGRGSEKKLKEKNKPILLNFFTSDFLEKIQTITTLMKNSHENSNHVVYLFILFYKVNFILFIYIFSINYYKT